MRKLVGSAAVALALALSSAASAQSQTTDPAEQSAFVAAQAVAAPAARASALEGFLKAHPSSPLRERALEQAVAAYQAAGDVAHVEDASRRLLTLDPGNVRALAVVAFLERARAMAETSPEKALMLADQSGADAERGEAALRSWTKPDGLSDSDFAIARAETALILDGCLGYRALLHKDYATARRYLGRAAAAMPGDLQNAWQFSIAALQSDPVDPAGFWWGAHAVNLAAAQGNAQAQTAIQTFVQPRYRRYHGGDDGWQALIGQAAAGALAPPAGFSVAQASAPASAGKSTLGPAELAVQAAAKYNPAELSFSDWSFILSQRFASPANEAAAAKVWAAILAKQGSGRMKLPGKVVSVAQDGLYVAVSEDSQAHNVADLHVVLDAPRANPPQPGAKITVVGVLTAYISKPFRIRMEKASIEP